MDRTKSFHFYKDFILWSSHYLRHNRLLIGAHPSLSKELDVMNRWNIVPGRLCLSWWFASSMAQKHQCSFKFIKLHITNSRLYITVIRIVFPGVEFSTRKLKSHHWQPPKPTCNTVGWVQCTMFVSWSQDCSFESHCVACRSLEDMCYTVLLCGAMNS